MPHNPPPVFGPAQFFSPTDLGDSLIFSDNNLVASYIKYISGWQRAHISDPFNAHIYNIAGKRYFEIFLGGGPANYCGVDIGFLDNTYTLYQPNPYGIPSYMAASCYTTDLTPGIIINGTQTNNGAYGMADGITVGVAVNGDNGKVFFSLDGAWISGDPGADSSPSTTLPNEAFTVWITTHSTGTNSEAPVFTARLADDILYPLPAGYKPWAQQSP
jgi:hypothetical protein